MSGIRVIAGSLKGRKIQFVNSRYDNADITPQRVKEALFSMLGGYLHGNSFLDLFACSGQMGIEAISRGADPVIMNEPDLKRRRFIQNWLKDTGVKGADILGLSYAAAIKNLSARGAAFDYIFLDPPYVKTREEAPLHSILLDLIEKESLLKDGGSVIIQHYSKNRMAPVKGSLNMDSTRCYGESALSVYRISENATILPDTQ